MHTVLYRRWLFSVCVSNSGQQENICLTGSVRLIKRIFTCERWGKHNGMNGDCEGAKCTYDGRKLYEEHVFKLSLLR